MAAILIYKLFYLSSISKIISILSKANSINDIKIINIGWEKIPTLSNYLIKLLNNLELNWKVIIQIGWNHLLIDLNIIDENS